jgi:hypothetical protein
LEGVNKKRGSKILVIFDGEFGNAPESSFLSQKSYSLIIRVSKNLPNKYSILIDLTKLSKVRKQQAHKPKKQF